MKRQQIIDILNEAYFSDNPHERELLEMLPGLLQGKDSFVDIGASLGQYTFHASRILRDSVLFAVEPDPVRFEALRENCETWAKESGNRITTIHAAMSEAEGPITFFSTHSNVSGGLFKHTVGNSDVDWYEESVPGVTLDSVLKSAECPLVKIDVEGAELRVLKGAVGTLKKGKAWFLIEVHPWTDPNGQKNEREVFRLLAAYGYRPVKIYGHYLFLRGFPKYLRLKAGEYRTRAWNLLRRTGGKR